MIYVVLPRDRIGEVMRGELNQLPVHDPAPVGAKVAVKVARNRRPTVIVQVTGCEPDPEGFTLTVRTIPLDHEPRLLAADSSRGYTRDPRLALQHEPEAVPEEFQDHLLMRALHRDTKRRREQSLAARRDRELLTVLERISLAKQAARENHVVIGTDILLLHRTMAEQRAGRRSETAVLRRLEEIERRAYRDAA
jgi:hypothetical protein